MDNKALVLVDFDHTLYLGDSLLDFTKQYKRNWFYINLFQLLPQYFLFKVGFLSSHQFKELFLKKNFKDEDYDVFCNKCFHFSEEIAKKTDRNLFKTLKKHNELQHDIFIVSASFSEWILPWASQFNIKVISSKLEVTNCKITGKILGKNCNYEEKVDRIKEEINLDVFSEIYVYGNGKGDLAMMELRKTK